MVQADVQSKIAQLKQDYEAVGNEVRETLSRLQPEDLKKKSGDSGRTVGVVAGHVARSPGSVVRYTKNVREGKPLKYPRFLLDIYNWFEDRGSRRMSVDQLLTTYDEGHAKLAADIESSVGDNWERKTRISMLDQDVDLETWFRMMMSHERDHLAELKAGLN